MTRKKFKGILIITAVAVLAAVSFFYPEHAESIARAFLLILGVI